ncbi:DUF805 domain-containing protein [Staphylococcus pettenkoferi]|uniref:DUF805 domain-containing protein n=1 Tax=Staphylococcus pettenkoferi TaxID=170573 RepID=UPI00066EB2DC|nr:DUF805 domain-containing protein [Staphylococcus pettenkoferi]MCY1567351.1 DUF805 domain-containing protein [Staphylococcus pettenkoferi]MCY1588208.1 DUF805 domain-containing protein [Staphylococcus pettenkoferi]MDK7115260.1 DUF805 domain-containing protein [Staphylococcus pettenkoferi]MDK7283692.1 DUF805 domain-containing protein [Staphylococcus pettenkoferi]
MHQSYIRFWRHAFDYKGRASRQDFWVPTLIHFVLYILLSAILSLILGDLSRTGVIVLSVFKWVLFIPQLTLMARRYHDVDKSLTFPLILFIFFLFLDINDFIDNLFYHNDPIVDYTDILAYILTAIYYLLLIYSLIVCLRRGNVSANRYGEPSVTQSGKIKE